MFSGGAAAEILVGYDDVALRHLSGKLRVDVLHAVLRQLLRIGGIEISGRDDDVRIDVVPVFICKTHKSDRFLSVFLSFFFFSVLSDSVLL